jgi:murein DD-endopeptidase MepM/ murein hydrolase activator NlpD
MADRIIDTFSTLTVKKDSPLPPRGWVWPVPPIRFSDGGAYPPVISDGFSAKASPGKREHLGMDIMFRRKSPSDRNVAYPPKTQNGSPGYFAPPGTPIVAARAATVRSVTQGPRGWAIVLVHDLNYATFYQHMERTTVKPTQLVKAGEQMGTMGSSRKPGALRHLHFAVWYKGLGDGASINAGVNMKTWGVASPWDVA